MNVAIPAGVNNEGIVPAVVTARVSMQYVHIGRRTMGSIEHLTYLCIASEVTSGEIHKERLSLKVKVQV